MKSLNPCCRGIWSRSYIASDGTPIKVLILVVVEYGLEAPEELLAMQILQCLNPCCRGIWSRSF